MTRPTKLNAAQKKLIANDYTFGTTITELANTHNVHPRTIYRALEDEGVLVVGKVAKKPSKASQALQVLKDHNLSIDDLKIILNLRRQASMARTPALFQSAPTMQAGAATRT
jgi:hypothetical protein